MDKLLCGVGADVRVGSTGGVGGFSGSGGEVDSGGVSDGGVVRVYATWVQGDGGGKGGRSVRAREQGIDVAIRRMHARRGPAVVM